MIRLISRWIGLTALVVGCFGAVGSHAAHAADQPAASRPNVLLIVSEDNGPELGCYGDKFARTPVLDRLASTGVRFERAFVPQAGCSQSRASFLTGLYPHQHGQIGLATWNFRMYRPDTPNVVRSLKEAGYRTGIVGKLHVNPESAFPFDMQEIHSGNFARKNIHDYAKFAEKFINAGDAPFFLSVNYPDAHDPWLHQVEGLPAHPLTGADVTPLAYQGIDTPELREKNADYYNCISRMDTLVGDLLAALDKSGKTQNTFIIYLGDHGADFLRGKRTCYEGGLRIPTLMRWPGHSKPGLVRQEMLSTIDYVPTILAAAGVAPPPGLPGKSALPLLEGESPAWRQYLFSEYHTHGGANNFYPQRAVRNDRFKLIQSLMPQEPNPGYDFTNSRLKSVPPAIEAAPPLIRDAYRRVKNPPEFELYDLQSDPYEFKNLADDAAFAAPLAELKSQLNDWRKQTGDPLLKPENLNQLKAEFGELTKSDAKEREWQYPNYFCGKPVVPQKEPTPGAGGKKKKKKKEAGDE